MNAPRHNVEERTFQTLDGITVSLDFDIEETVRTPYSTVEEQCIKRCSNIGSAECHRNYENRVKCLKGEA